MTKKNRRTGWGTPALFHVWTSTKFICFSPLFKEIEKLIIFYFPFSIVDGGINHFAIDIDKNFIMGINSNVLKSSHAVGEFFNFMEIKEITFDIPGWIHCNHVAMNTSPSVFYLFGLDLKHGITSFKINLLTLLL